MIRSHTVWVRKRNSVINSLAPGKFEWNFRYLIFQIISVIDGWGIPCELALRWMSLDLSDDKSTLVQVMAWCRQATSHYLSQCWPRSLPPYGVTRPQFFHILKPTVQLVHSKSSVQHYSSIRKRTYQTEFRPTWIVSMLVCLNVSAYQYNMNEH